MSYKRKKTDSSNAKRFYTTRQIMEITEQRRLKELGAGKDIEPKAKAPDNEPAPVAEEIKPPVIEEKTEAAKSEVQIPAKNIAGVIVLILSIIVFFLIVSSRNSAFWVDPLVAQLNALIAFGSFCVLRILQGATLQGAVLSTHYYKVSLQGDLTAVYSLELLIAFAALFIFFQRSAWNKWGRVFMALVPLAVIANIFRVVMAFGYALNYGTGVADRYFHGILVAIVFIILLLGLMFFEYLTSSE
jgi:exosortase/archaeosortase family protein